MLTNNLIMDLGNYSIKSAYVDLITSCSEYKANVGICIPNSIQYVDWLVACYKADRIAVPIFYGSSANEIKNIINACDLQILIYMPPVQLTEIVKGCKYGISFINCITLEILSVNKPFIRSKANKDTVLMISTSGSVDSPKRVMLSEKNLVKNANDIISSLDYDASEVFMAVLPMCFASANTSQLTVAFLLGARILPYNGVLHPSAIANAIQKYNVTSITLTPSLFKFITDSSYFTCDTLPSLNTICFGGGPSDMLTIEKAKKKFANINLTQMYGQTEASARISHMRLHKDVWISESVGKPIGDMCVRVANKDGYELPVGNEGRIQVKGGNVFSGYYGQPELTQKVFVDGWLNTGDVGKLDEAGNIYITGRERNLIIYCGFNIYPEEVENVISSNAAVEDSVVYGEKHSVYGELVVADIVVKGGYKVKEANIIEYCKRYLPIHKVPYRIRFVKNINKTSNGKKARKRT